MLTPSTVLRISGTELAQGQGISGRCRKNSPAQPQVTCRIRTPVRPTRARPKRAGQKRTAEVPPSREDVQGLADARRSDPPQVLKVVKISLPNAFEEGHPFVAAIGDYRSVEVL